VNDDAPLLVVVTGPPASGKSTIAHALSKRLGLPLIAKDEIKESLFDALGVGDVDWSSRLGAATFEIQMVVLGELLRTRVSVIVESNFTRGRAEHELAKLPRHRAPADPRQCAA
jgi:predicted kinase